VQRTEQTEVLLARRHDLVVRAEVEPREDDVAAVRRRAGERHLRRVDADERGEPAAQLVAEAEHPREVRRTEPAALAVRAQLGVHRVERRPRQRAERAGVEVGVPLEHGEERPRLLEGHPTVTSTGAWSDRRRPP
jgi:hypothetical protein